MTWTGVFENLSVQDLSRPHSRISWSAGTLKAILSFCAEHQVSDRNRPSPEQLVQLLNKIDAPTSDVDAWKAAGTKTLACIASRTAQLAKAGDVLKEVKSKDGKWVCQWAQYSLLWTDKEWTGETVVVETELSPAEAKMLREFRPVVARRHELGHKRLVDAAAHVYQQRLKAGEAFAALVKEEDSAGLTMKKSKKPKKDIHLRNNSTPSKTDTNAGVSTPNSTSSSPAAVKTPVLPSTMVALPRPRQSPVAIPSPIVTDSECSFTDFIEASVRKNAKLKKAATTSTSIDPINIPARKENEAAATTAFSSVHFTDVPARKKTKTPTSEKGLTPLSPPATPRPSQSPLLPAVATAPLNASVVDNDDWLNI
ncbi:hypothetical protein CB0940_07959 [Cercospora beticola]|uniref:Uncharacterized protein n=1 Tax=Cercospora beticola TaxID=122368 RepID=A0A2G5HA29_CERBT|nr:hypothetical protein CB0940_07959 [Cercospora beticola]PIA89400.1 hypothetical protein CB0940_07959 [Cercospora beticola]WPB08540.1 hypothetical protein RHO25_013206 [Cercospora beticola]